MLIKGREPTVFIKRLLAATQASKVERQMILKTILYCVCISLTNFLLDVFLY